MYLAGKSKAIDMFLNFPVMDMNRNAIWHQPEKVPQDGIKRMSRFWGDESWRTAAYGESKQADLFGFGPKKLKQPNDGNCSRFRQAVEGRRGLQLCR